jgi:RNA polymerase sigma-70 factor, ECF subfamily
MEMSEDTENEIEVLSRAKAGCPEAWDALLSRHRLPLYIYILQLTRNEQTSFDLVQETFLSAVKHIKTLQDSAKFGSWLFGIAHQKCIQSWRKQTREEDALKDFIEEPTDFEEDPRQTLIRQEEEAQFMKLIHRLPVPQRSVIVLYFVEDFSLEEIAGITGTSIGTVKSRLHYAKKAFRELWKDNVI